MKIVIATTPAPGHVNPMLGIARILVAEGHEVIAFTGRAFQDRIKEIGAAFRPIPASADQDVVDPFSKYPELKTLPPGLELLHQGALIRRPHSRAARGVATSVAGSPGRHRDRR
jgi:glycosyl transferase family 28